MMDKMMMDKKDMMMNKKKMMDKKEMAFDEVMHNEPSTVKRANVSEARKRKMRIAIALQKARKSGVKIPKKK